MLTASTNGITKVLRESSNLFDIEYNAWFPFNDADTLFKISLTRENDEDAKNSTVKLPSPIDITSPFAWETFTAADQVNVAWQPSNQGDTVKINICYECTRTDSFGSRSTISSSRTLSVKNDPGILYYTVARLINVPNPAIYDQGCEIELTLIRSRKGKLDSNFREGGSIGAVQTDTVNFFYIPDRIFQTEENNT
ncbi:MAG: hypothetical protein JRI86_09675 [Deltaproteobacteria bacterium]|nr:hypothetical protein [Deltaproteobacteria bacterium]